MPVPREERRHPINRRLGGPQSRSGSWEQKISCPYQYSIPGTYSKYHSHSTDCATPVLSKSIINYKRSHTNNILFSFGGTTTPSELGPPYYPGFTITLNQTPHSVGILWTSDQPDAEISTWQHTTLTRDRHLCPRRESNAQTMKAIGRRPTS